MSTLGNCQTDNQGNPIPGVGGTCNLAGMHLDASTIDTPDASDIYGNGMINNGMLDWEFYGVNQRASAGANPPVFTCKFLWTARGCNGLRCHRTNNANDSNGKNSGCGQPL